MSAQEKPSLSQQDTHEFDVQAGGRLRKRRLELGYTQEKLGNLLGLTFQQVQKYERGVNRISASRLNDIARLLQVPVTYFYGAAQLAAGFAEGEQESLEGSPGQDTTAKETAELLQAYYNIDDPEKRRRVLELIRAMAEK